VTQKQVQTIIETTPKSRRPGVVPKQKIQEVPFSTSKSRTKKSSYYY
jgi:hypothetical protein